MSKRAEVDRRAAPKTLSGFFRGVDAYDLLPQLIGMLRRAGADPRVIQRAEWSRDHRWSLPTESREVAVQLFDSLAGRSSQPAMHSLRLRYELAHNIIVDERAHALSVNVLERMGVPSITRLGVGQHRLFLTGLSMLLTDCPPGSGSFDAEDSR